MALELGEQAVACISAQAGLGLILITVLSVVEALYPFLLVRALLLREAF
jgi:hypothetical protein